MMYGLLMALVLTKAPDPAKAVPDDSAVILVERVSGLSPKRTQALVEVVSALLEREGIPSAVAPEQVTPSLRAVGEPPAASCEGQRPCLVRLGRSLGATLVVLLEAETLADTLGLHLEAVSTRDGSSLREATIAVERGHLEEVEEAIVPFARELRSALVPPAPPEDAPLAEPPAPPAVTLEPLPSPEATAAIPEAALPSASPQPSRALLYTLGGGAVVTAGAAVAFGILGLKQKSRLEGARFVDPVTGSAASRLSRSEAERLSHRSNDYFTLALSSALVSAVLGSTAAGLWVKEEPRR
jgi:hypothetical protein